MIQDGSLAILGFSGLSMARPCVLFPVPRYLRGRQARSVRTGFYFSAVKVSNPGRCLPHSPLPTPHSPITHGQELLVADGEELLPVGLLHLIREAVQEVVHS